MSVETTLKVKKYIVCSTGEEMDEATPNNDLDAAIALRDKRQNNETNSEGWYIYAEIDV